MVRQGNLILTAALAGFISVFFLIFLDPLLKRAVVGIGQKIFQARVDVKKIETKIFQGKIAVHGLTVADKKEPMRNLFEWQKAQFQIKTAPMLEKKLVIEEAAVEGLMFNTARQVSGALPKKTAQEKEEVKPSALEEKINMALSQTQNFGLSRLENLKKEGQGKIAALNPENLSSLKILDESENKIGILSEQWSQKSKTLETELKTDIEKIQNDIETLKSASGNDVAAAVEKAKKVKEIERAVKAIELKINENKKSAEQDFKAAKSLIEQAREAKKKDFEILKEMVGLPRLDGESLTQTLLGREIKQRLSQILSLMELAKKYFPDKEQKPQAQKPPRQRGVAIAFPKHDIYPSFVLKKAGLSGRWGQDAKALDFSGFLHDASNAPALWPQPLSAKIEGAKNEQQINAELIINRRTEIPSDIFSLHLKGLPLENVTLGNPQDLGLTLTRATSNAQATLIRRGEYWNGEVKIFVGDAQLKPQLGFSGKIADRLSAALGAIGAFSVNLNFEGAPQDLKWHLKSDLGGRISEILQSLLQNEIDEQKKMLQAKVNELFDKKREALTQKLNGAQADALNSLGAHDKRLAQLLQSNKEGQKPALAVPEIKSLQKLFR